MSSNNKADIERLGQMRAQNPAAFNAAIEKIKNGMWHRLHSLNTTLTIIF